MIYVLINDVEYLVRNLAIQNLITRTPDTANFILENPDIVPSAGMTVLIYRDTISDTLFGGSVYLIHQSKLTPNEDTAYRTYSYTIRCIDYQRLLDRYLVNEVYSSQTCKQIIDDIVATYTDPALSFTTTNTETGPTITKVTFSYKKPTVCISELADLVGYDWYVDEDKDIHFFQKQSDPAPYNIDDDTLAGLNGRLVNNFNLIPDYSQVRNRIYVRGGYQLSDPYTESFVADGETRVFKLGWKPHNVSAFSVDGTPKTYAVDNVNADDGTYQYYWNYQEKYIRAGDGTPTATPGNGDVISITYQYEIPILIRVDDYTSQAAIAALETGTGIYESVIKDQTISSETEAQDRGMAELESFANPIISGSFITYDHNFRAGQYVVVDSDGYSNYNGTYAIQQVSIRSAAPELVEYTVMFATTLYQLKDLLLKLLRTQKQITLRDDETIDVLKVVDEEVIFTVVNVISLHAMPYKWNQFKWTQGAWA